MSRNSRRRRRKDKSDIGIFEIVNGLLTFLLTGLGILVSWTMLKYNFLNFKGINYAILIIIILTIVLAGVLLINKKARVFNLVMLILMNIALVFSYMQFRAAINLFDDINEKAAFSEYTMSVVVLKDDVANTLNDIKDELVAAPTSADSENINKFLKEIREKENKQLELVDSKS